MSNTHCTHPGACHYQVVLIPNRSDHDRTLCSCVSCRLERANEKLAQSFRDQPVATGTGRADEVQEALQALVGVVDRIGGYMTPEDQRVLWRARSLSRGGR
jgi:hypothetical protein